MSWTNEVCPRCVTTHPENAAGERICPAPPIEYVDSDEQFCPGVIWKCGGGTRGFGGSRRIPKMPGLNPGHREPTLGMLGLTSEDGEKLGIT